MINFEKYSKTALLKYTELIKNSPLKCCDVSLGAFIMYGEDANLELASVNETFISKQDILGEPVFSFPFGNEDNRAIDHLFEYIKQKNLPFVLYGVDDDLLIKIKKDSRFDGCLANYDRRWSDYVYSFNEMKSFAGGKFSGQRNHINKFIKLYGMPNFTKLENSDISNAKDMLKEYSLYHTERGKKEEDELKATQKLLECFNDFNLLGGKLTIDGKIVGFSIGEIIGDTLVIHVEKALTKYDGIYPTLFNSFVKYVDGISDVKLNYVNREDDSGDEGLRKSKLQYKPIYLVNKNLVKIKPFWQPNDYPVLKGEGVVLSKIKEEDKKNYLELCTDEELNSLWGYDYKEDDSIPSKIDENTFFNMQVYDNSIGFSINLAIREREDGELIGETIIYNTTFNNDAEIGCRISKEYQQKGLGKRAFALTVNFAKSLGLNPIVKCYKQNEPSKNMILSSGFKIDKIDDNFYHFILENSDKNS